MSVRNLEVLFRPRSVALIGASKQERSVGAVLAHNLSTPGSTGRSCRSTREGVLTYTDRRPAAGAGLAVVATPPATVPEIVAILGARAVVIITAGFGELGESGRALQQAMLDAARPYTLGIVGPNCLGVMVPGHGLNASFAQAQALRGDLAFVSQSGAVHTRYGPGVSIPTDNGAEIEALAGSSPSFAAWEQDESYTIALLIKGRSGGA